MLHSCTLVVCLLWLTHMGGGDGLVVRRSFNVMKILTMNTMGLEIWQYSCPDDDSLKGENGMIPKEKALACTGSLTHLNYQVFTESDISNYTQHS